VNARFALASLATHAALFAAIAVFVARDSGHVEGSAGLAGNTSTRFNVTMEAVATPALAVKPPAPPTDVKRPAPPTVTRPLAVSEGLPVEVKNPHPKEIDAPPSAARPPVGDAQGDSNTAPVGPRGQGGTGSEVAAKIGDSDRSNRLGLYLQKMQRKIQSNLGTAGYLQFPTHAKLILDLRKDGNVTKITVAETSGDAALDRLAIRAVQKSIPFDPWEQDQAVELPVVFR
jgi:TonB family protein